MNTFIRTHFYTALSLVLGTAAISAIAASPAAAEDVPSKTVRYSDLDITKPAGAQALYARIHAAARDVCELSTRGDPLMGPAVHACIDTAIDNAVRKVNAPALTSLRFGGDIRLASK